MKMQKSKMSLMTFMSGLITCLLILFIVLFAGTFGYIYKTSITESAMIGAEQAVSLVRDTLDMNLDSINQDFFLIEDKVKECRSEEELKQYLNSVVNVRSGIVTIMVYDTNGELLNYGSDESELKNQLGENLSYLPDIFNNDNDHISTPHVQNMYKSYYPWVVTIGYKVYSALYGQDVYLAMDISFSKVLSYINLVNIGKRGYCFVMDEQGNYVYHPQQQLIFSGMKTEDMEFLMQEPDGTTIVGDKIYSISTMSNYGWKIVGISYTEEMIQEKIIQMYEWIFEIALGCIALALLAIWISGNKISKPMKELTKAMQQFEVQVEDYRYSPVKGIQEIESLSKSFDHLVIMIQNLMIHIKEEETQLRKTELKALQMQINPHFLYNTLDSIQWMCEQGENERAVKMVSALAKLFRISISKGKEFITIKQELIHVKNYMIIQSFRFHNQFQYEFDVDDNILQYYCNKITLQPLVENAIIHGIEGLCDEGEIRITAKQDGEEVVLIVEDNGVGMSQEQCEKIFKHDTTDNFGIGIKNVNDRLKIYFGEQYGLKIESELDEGTKITIRFPKIDEEYLKKEGLQ